MIAKDNEGWEWLDGDIREEDLSQLISTEAVVAGMRAWDGTASLIMALSPAGERAFGFVLPVQYDDPAILTGSVALVYFMPDKEHWASVFERAARETGALGGDPIISPN